MSILEVSGLSKYYGDTGAVREVSFTVEYGDIVGLLGPSGCGKTTLLRLLAGIDEPDQGTICFDGNNIDSLEPQNRGFGLMFQNLALFPHMNVFANIAFGLRMQGIPKQDINTRVNDLLELVDLSGYNDRKVQELSGGERQRVALARSMAPSPRLLMLDEPLGSIDRILADSLQRQIRAILKKIGVTSIYVTHDWKEAFSICDKIIFMNEGKITQSGNPEYIISHPNSELIARSIGFKNVFNGTLVSEGNTIKIQCEMGYLHTSISSTDIQGTGPAVNFFIHEDGITLNKQSTPNSMTGLVTEKTFHGTGHEIIIQYGNVELFCKIPFNLNKISDTPDIGNQVNFSIDIDSVRLLR